MSTILILLFAFHIIPLTWFINLFSYLYLIPVLILLGVLLYKTPWRLSFTGISSVTRRLKRRMISFGLFIFGAQFLNVLSRTNDSILVIGLRGLADTGVFTIANYFIAIMEIPQRSLNAISYPVLAEAWKNKDLKSIENIYRKSVINLLVIALGLFGLICLSIHDITQFLGKSYYQIESIVFILGLAKVLDLGTGINSTIIGTSNYWKFDFYTNVIYTILSIPLNFFLIKYLGLIGLAFSTLLSLTIYNLIRFIFIYKKFGFQPYTVKAVLALVIATLAYFLVYNIPQFPNIFVDIIIRSLCFVLLFVVPMYYGKVAPDLNGVLEKFIKQMFTLVKAGRR
jgi:O-antigen/teichoic acid export membrane protein